jgi:glycosyltransferase involved in cell wall biosynthesis
VTSDDRRSLHLFWSPLEHETRMFKEARACLELGIFDEVHVLGYQAPGLKAQERHASGLLIHRLLTPSARIDRSDRSHARYVRVAAAVASLLHYAFGAVRSAVAVKPTHISCHNPILLPMAFLAAMFCRAQVVYVPHELEVERAGLTGAFKRLSAAFERWFIRRCSAVVVVCEPIAEWYRDHYGLEAVHVVRAIPEARAVEARDPAARDEIRRLQGVPDEALLFIYQGLLEPARGVDLLLEAFLGLDEPFHLMLMGYGGSEARVREATDACPRIHFQPAVPIDQIVRYSASADVGVFALSNPVARSYQLSLPNKFFEYVAAGLPVLVSDNLELLSGLVGNHGLGWVAAPENLRATIGSIGRDAISERMPAVAQFAANNTWERERLVYQDVYGREAGSTPVLEAGDRA